MIHLLSALFMHCSYNTFLVSTIKNRLPEDVWVGGLWLMGSACTGNGQRLYWNSQCNIYERYPNFASWLQKLHKRSWILTS